MTDEQKAAWVQKTLAHPDHGPGRPAGLPRGWTKDDWDFHIFSVRHTSRRYMEQIIKDNELDKTNPDDAYAIEALEAAVTIMRSQAPLKEKLAASKIILEFTKAKPSTKSEVTLNTAEDFLAKVIQEENKK